MKSAPDRLGDALREIAAGMAEGGTTSCRFCVDSERSSAHFELRLVSVVKKRPKRVGGVLVIYPNSKKGNGTCRQ